MAVLKLYEYPHPILKKKAQKVEKVDDDMRKFLDDMLETMYADAGVGLAAPQVGVSQRRRGLLIRSRTTGGSRTLCLGQS